MSPLTRFALISCLFTIAPATAIAADELETVKPIEINDPLPNPYMGWGLWAGPRFFDGRPFSVAYNTEGFGDDAPLFGWVLVDWMWSDLEPEEGHYRWDDLDAILNYWSARHKQFLVRLWVTTDPGWAGAAGNKACPDWLWEAGVKFHSYKGEGGVVQRCPAYVDPSWEREYLPRLRQFLTAYRDRYHKPGSPIVLDQVMGFGDWGEWHTMWSHYPWPTRELKRSVLTKVINTYTDIFGSGDSASVPLRNLSIAQVYDDDCGGDLSLDQALHRQALDVAIAKGFAFSRHGFIDGLGGWPDKLMDREWKDHQLIAESNWSYEQVKDHKNHGSMAEHVGAYERLHSSYAHMYFHASSYRRAMSEDRPEIERALESGGIGYRFVLTSAAWQPKRKPGQTLKLRQEWVNRNQSWCVHPYRLRLYLVNNSGKTAWSGTDPKFDPRSWLRGTTYAVDSTLALPEDVKPGRYDLRIALVDDSGTPRVRLGIGGGDADLRYRLGTVVIASADGPEASPEGTDQKEQQP